MHLFHPTNAVTSISWDGQQFQPDVNGVFDVPDGSRLDLAAFGLVAGDPAPAPEPADIQVPVSNWKNDALLAKAVELGLDLPADIKRPALIQAVTDALKA